MNIFWTYILYPVKMNIFWMNILYFLNIQNIPSKNIEIKMILYENSVFLKKWKCFWVNIVDSKMNNFFDWIFWIYFWIYIELNHFFQNVSARANCGLAATCSASIELCNWFSFSWSTLQALQGKLFHISGGSHQCQI